ncbi:hypothetical protein GCM10020219_037910 [Nonomuraea dietziae]
MTQVEIGRGKTGRRAYALDEIGLVPSRRTRDPEEVSIAWQIDAYRFELPVVVAPMDSVVSPATAIAIGRLGGLAPLDLEGLWTRYEDPSPLLEECASLDIEAATRRLQEIYTAPIKEELIGRRIQEIRDAGVTTAVRLSPQRTVQFHKTVIDAGVDIFVIRGTTVSAEHVSSKAEPLNLKQFIYELDVPVIVGGCATYTAALHLMRTGAAGVLVGFGGGASHTTRNVLGVAVPMATAISDVAAARRDYLDESGGRYVHVIADGGMGTSGDIAKAIACGADAVMVGSPLARASEAPGHGFHWGFGGAPPRPAARAPRGVRHGRHPGADPARALQRGRRLDEPHGRAQADHGLHGLLRHQGVPARRGGRGARPALTRPNPARPAPPYAVRVSSSEGRMRRRPRTASSMPFAPWHLESPAMDLRNTHAVSVVGEVVTKRFTDGAQGRGGARVAGADPAGRTRAGPRARADRPGARRGGDVEAGRARRCGA